MTLTIWHNSRCDTSRATPWLLRARGVEPVVAGYPKTPPTAADIAPVRDTP